MKIAELLPQKSYQFILIFGKDLPATLEHADPIPWKARATNNTAYVSPNAKTVK